MLENGKKFWTGTNRSVKNSQENVFAWGEEM